MAGRRWSLCVLRAGGGSERAGARRVRVPGRPGHLTLSFLWFALNFQSSALLPILIPTQLLLLVAPGQTGSAQQATFLAWLSTLGALLALCVPPLTGALSDRTAGEHGRRRPYVTLGALLLVAGALCLGLPGGIGLLVVGFALFQLGNNIATAGYQGLIPDLVPEGERGTASGYMGLMTVVGNAGSLALAGLLLSQVAAGAPSAEVIHRGSAIYYLLTGIILAAGALVTVWGIHEAPLSLDALEALAPDAATAEQSFLRRLAGQWTGPLRDANFRWVFLTRCFVMLGLTLFLTFIEYYFANVAGVSNFVQMTAVLALLALLGALFSALSLGILSDRIRTTFGRIPLVFGSSLCMAAAALAFFIVPQGAPLWPLGIVFGLGYGAYTSVDWALAVDMLPSRADAGKDMGIWSIASNLPAVVAPLLGGIVIDAGAFGGQIALGYRAVFLLALLSLLAGAGCILLVREGANSANSANSMAATQPAQGGSDPPEERPAAIRRVARGWRFASGAGSGRPRGFLWLWRVYERISLAILRPQPIPDAPAGIFLVRFIRYHGKPITLPDGTHIARGDLVGELHLHNARVPDLASRAGVFELAHMMAADLGALARWVERGDTTEPVAHMRALTGLTLLGRASRRLGFTVRERPHTLMSEADRIFMTGLLALYSPQGLARLAHGRTYGSYPSEVWMSRATLLQRYAPHDSGANDEQLPV